MGSDMDAIHARALIKKFGPITALDGIDLEIRAGELFFLLGASGCGKTTLLRCIAGLETPSSGTIHFGEREVTRLPPHQREAAMVFQNYALWPHLSVARNVSFGLEERRLAKPEIGRRVDEALEMVHLQGMGERGVDQLSGGQQQRVALARALVVRPRCLLLDEPLSNLDAKLRVEMRREIRRIVKEGRLTGVYVTHDQEEALAMADRMAVLRDGRIEQLGTPQEIYRSPRTSFVASFIGETNLFSGAIVGVEQDEVCVEVVGQRWRGRVADGAWRPAAEEPATVSIRPESWSLRESAGPNRLAGRIVDHAYLGQRIQYAVETELGVQQVVEMAPDRVLAGGTEVELGARPGDVVVMRG